MILTLLTCFLAVIPNGQKTVYTNSETKYSIEYPNDWVKNEQTEGFDLFILSPQKDDKGSVANMSIISGQIPADVTLDVYYAENMKELKNLGEIEIKGEGTKTVAGAPAKWVRYTRKDDQSEIIHIFFLQKSNGYLITEGTAIGAFDTYSPVFDQIVGSFKFTQ